MTRADFIARFPRATEAVIRLNCSDAITRIGPAPLPRPPSPAKAKETPSSAKPVGKRQRVPRTRNAGTWTEAQFWGHVRSALRHLSRWWKPSLAALRAARVPFHGPRGQKWAYLCARCGKLHPRKRVNIDHREPAGTLTEYAHLPGFVARLTPESIDAYQILCTQCHQTKTNAERSVRNPSP